MRDTKSYCGVLLDNNNRKPICRLHFNRSKKYFGVFDSGKNETRHEVESPLDIFKYESELIACIKNYDVSPKSEVDANEQPAADSASLD